MSAHFRGAEPRYCPSRHLLCTDGYVTSFLMSCFSHRLCHLCDNIATSPAPPLQNDPLPPASSDWPVSGHSSSFQSLLSSDGDGSGTHPEHLSSVCGPAKPLPIQIGAILNCVKPCPDPRPLTRVHNNLFKSHLNRHPFRQKMYRYYDSNLTHMSPSSFCAFLTQPTKKKTRLTQPCMPSTPTLCCVWVFVQDDCGQTLFHFRRKSDISLKSRKSGFEIEK